MERSDWLLATLYSPAGKTGRTSDSIDGSVRLMKNLFLLWKEIDELPNFYKKFVPYLYGPCCFDVYKDLEKLKDDGVVDEANLPNRRWSIFRLTAKGKDKGKKIFDDLPKKTKDKMVEIKGLVERFSFLGLLIYVYNRYPEYMRKSIIYVPRGIKA